jgi:hypothetical protein
VRVRDTQILRRVPASVRQIFDMDDVRFTAENLQLELPVVLRLPVHGDIVMDFCPRPLFSNARCLGFSSVRNPVGRPVPNEQVHALHSERVADCVRERVAGEDLEMLQRRTRTVLTLATYDLAQGLQERDSVRSWKHASSKDGIREE